MKNILIVEDELLIANTIKRQLINYGYLVTGIATDPTTALRIAFETRPDLVLIDVWLKGGADGVGLAEQISRDLQIPFVFLTASSDDATLERMKATSPLAIIIK